jgi:predicted MPP superfamily phosphohydrolase
MSKNLRIAVVSDIHAHTLQPNDPKAPSYLSLHSSDGQPLLNPMAGLFQLIADQNLEADLVLCGGDMCDKANSAAQTYVWSKLQSLGQALGNARVIGTAGNHDMDSRFNEDFDAKGALQSLVPAFPGLDDHACDRFWSRNFVIVEGEGWRLLNLNSSAYHGYRAPTADEHAGDEEYNRGRVSLKTIAEIVRQMDGRERKAVNILLTHHHPLRNSDIPNSADYSEMVLGDQLVNAIGDLNVGDWMVIHGHKHFPKIWYAGGTGGRTPVVFSAGSFSAKLYAEIGALARNQFYIVDIPLSAVSAAKIGVLGQITAWDWIHAQGWIPAQSASGVVHKSGFGWRENPDSVSKVIAEAFSNLSGPFGEWSAIVEAVPFAKYLSPASLVHVQRALLDDYGLELLFDQNGPRHIGLKT